MKHYHKKKDYFIPEELNCIVFSFTLRFEKHVPKDVVLSIYNGIHLDLQKSFAGMAKIHMYRGSWNRMQVSLNMTYPCNVYRAMHLVGSSFRYCYEVEIPLCLYMLRTEISEEIKKITDSTGALAFIKICNKVIVFVCGKERVCSVTRAKILQMIEEMFGRPTRMLDVPVSIFVAVEQNARIFSVSRINSTESLISGSISEFLPKDTPFVVERFVFDTRKLEYLFLYRRVMIEDILSDSQSYMVTKELYHGCTEVTLKGFDLYEVKRARNSLNLLYNFVVKMVVEDVGDFWGDDVIILKFSDNKWLVIGEVDALVEILSNKNVFADAEMDIENNTALFLSGKRNGKVLRIMKDTGCSIYKRREDARVFLNICGESVSVRNALGMIKDEFPDELTFHVDEKHHRRIIGYEGKNIQRMMKKHGVYIKFMRDKERRYMKYKDNVVIKTPRKNSEGLTCMRDDVMSLVGDVKMAQINKKHTVSLHCFYDLEHLKCRLFYNNAVVESTGDVAPSYYIHNNGSRLGGCLKGVLNIPKTNQWFINTIDILQLERATSMHWLRYIREMKKFSWLFGHTYESLFCETKDEDVRIPTTFLLGKVWL